MRIRTLLVSVVSVALLMVVGLVMASWFVTTQQERLSSAQARAQSAAREVSALLVVTHDFAAYSEQRAEQQWRAHHSAVMSRLQHGQSDPIPCPAEAVLEAQALGEIFERLSGVLPGKAELQIRQRQLLLDQLLTSTQILSESIDAWGNATLARHLEVERAFRRLALLTPLLMLLILGFLANLLFRRVLRPMSALHEAVTAVSRGNLTVRSATPVQDEFGELSRAFDAMAVDMVSELRQEVSERKQVELALRAAERKFRGLVEQSLVGVYVIQGDRFRYVNPYFASLLGYDGSDEIIDILPVSQLVRPEDRQRVAENVRHRITGRLESIRYSFTALCKDGRHIDLEVFGNAVESDGVPSVIGVAIDITERHQAEDQLRIAAATFESQEGFVVTDAAGRILRINPSFSAITGYTAEEVIGRNMHFLKSGRHDAEFYTAMWQTILNLGAWQGEIWNRIKNGEIHPHGLSISAVKDNSGRTTHYVGGYTDITERKKMEEQVKKLAFHDSLTGLPNRRLLNDRLAQSMAANKRSGCYGALLFLDLDNFKPLNDTHGHEVGDLLLIEAANRLKLCGREMDTVARFGGDEFVVIIEQLDTDQNAATASAAIVAEKVRCALSAPYRLRRAGAADEAPMIVHHCTVSIGVAMFINHEASQDEIIKRADTAMYAAKAAGRNLIRFHAQP